MACFHCRGVEAEDQLITCVVVEGGPCSACDERATIRQKIEQLEGEIAKLKAKHHALGSAMNAIHDRFIHKLPPEISSHIFRFTLQTFDCRDTRTKGNSGLVVGPLRLGAVCRKWRQLAWATLHLWETIYIAIQPSKSLSLAQSLPGLVREWLVRSGGLPLTIFFSHPGSSNRTDMRNNSSDEGSTSENYRIAILEAATSLIIEILNSHSSRWRNLHLHVGADILEHFSGRTQPMQLFVLKLVVTGVISPTQKFIMESNPKYITLMNLPLSSINIGWKNVSHAMLDLVSVCDCIEFLRRAPALEGYRISIHNSVAVNRFETSTLHPRLRFFHLSRKSPEYLLDIINLPSLEQFTYNLDYNAVPVTPMLSFLQRSNCRLRGLNLISLRAPSEDLHILLQAIPSLECLRLSFRNVSQNCTVMDNILTQILHSGPVGGGNISVEGTTPEPLLPHLQFMECWVHFPGALFSWDRIPQLYRQGHKRSLVLKSIACESGIRDETALQLLQLVDEGVDLRIHDQKGRDFLKNFRNRMGKQGF